MGRNEAEFAMAVSWSPWIRIRLSTHVVEAIKEKLTTGLACLVQVIGNKLLSKTVSI